MQSSVKRNLKLRRAIHVNNCNRSLCCSRVSFDNVFETRFVIENLFPFQSGSFFCFRPVQFNYCFSAVQFQMAFCFAEAMNNRSYSVRSCSNVKAFRPFYRLQNDTTNPKEKPERRSGKGRPTKSNTFELILDRVTSIFVFWPSFFFFCPLLSELGDHREGG